MVNRVHFRIDDGDFWVEFTLEGTFVVMVSVFMVAGIADSCALGRSGDRCYRGVTL